MIAGGVCRPADPRWICLILPLSQESSAPSLVSNSVPSSSLLQQKARFHGDSSDGSPQSLASRSPIASRDTSKSVRSAAGSRAGSDNRSSFQPVRNRVPKVDDPTCVAVAIDDQHDMRFSYSHIEPARLPAPASARSDCDARAGSWATCSCFRVVAIVNSTTSGPPRVRSSCPLRPGRFQRSS